MPSNRLRDSSNSGHVDEHSPQVQGFYVHSSPPKVFQVKSNNIRQWLKTGDLARLEDMVFQGRGHQLIGQYSPDPKVRHFLKQVPAYVNKINEVHEATIKGDLATLQRLFKAKTYNRTMPNVFLSRNPSGVGLLHKAVFYGHPDVVQFLADSIPQEVNARDGEGRTPLHYCGASAESAKIWSMLTKAGADPRIADSRGHVPTFYMNRENRVSLPTETTASDVFAKNGVTVKASNIRIWIHDRDLEKLQRLIWEGHGGKLLVETSNHPRVKRFLEGVPHALNSVKDVHSAVINGDYEEFVKSTAYPVPQEILESKDANGLNPLHKAAGLGRLDIARNVLDRRHHLVSSVDRQGRTPLHFAAAATAARRSDDSTYKLLVERGADETALDNNGKPPSYYKTSPKEVAKYLKVVPEAPRTSYSYPQNWDWTLIQSSDSTPTTLAPIDEPATGRTSSVEMEEPFERDRENELTGVEARVEGQTDTVWAAKTEKEVCEEVDEEASGSNEDVQFNDVGGESAKEENESAVTDQAESMDEYRRDQDEYYEIWTNKNADVETEAGDENKLNNEETEVIVAGEPAAKNTPRTENQEKSKKETFNDGENQVVRAKEKTAWEIGEERQRLLDEGITQINNDDDDDDYDDDDDDDDRHHDKGDVTDGVNDTVNDRISGQGIQDLDRMINDGDMEALALVVLNGDGAKLAGKTSENPEVGTFLENLASYMNKISAVHKSVRKGSLRDLQAALDRRRFAVAKETSEGLAATPLHVAVLLGRRQIVKYLGGRFPETLSFKDNQGRTPLHYAAVLPDDGHLFNVLLNLGSDRKVKDEAGLTPGDYHENPLAPTHEKLLEEYDTPGHVARDMLTGQDHVLFGTEDGEYLAEALGRPLIRGLTEVAKKRPRNPVAFFTDFLYRFLDTDKGSGGDSNEVNESGVRVVGPEESFDEGDTFGPNKWPERGKTEGGEEAGDHDTGIEFAVTERDEFGQSILHFAAARAHGRAGLFHLIQDSGANLGCRDELYRTARDVAMQAKLQQNMDEIDKFVISLVARGDIDKVKQLYMEGYDHIVDLKDEEVDSNADDIVTIASKKNHNKMASFLKGIPAFETNREKMHDAIRRGNFQLVRHIIDESRTARFAAVGKNTSGRCSLHIAVLCQQEEIAEFIAQKYPETLKIGDNLERTALHYAMGVDQVESLSRILVKCGASRISKDLKGRQPTYYFMNKTEITKLQEEESV